MIIYISYDKDRKCNKSKHSSLFTPLDSLKTSLPVDTYTLIMHFIPLTKEGIWKKDMTSWGGTNYFCTLSILDWYQEKNPRDRKVTYDLEFTGCQEVSWESSTTLYRPEDSEERGP